MIGARNRSNYIGGAYETIACYYQYIYSDNSDVTIRENVCQGSQGLGFLIPFTACDNLNANTGYTKNTAGSCRIGFVMNHYNTNNNCKTAGYLNAYGCDIGITSNPNALELRWDRLMLADNKRALGLRFAGSSQNNNNLFLKNSWISAVSRPQC